MTEFPERWARASIGEAATLINGRAFKPTDWGTVGLPIIRIQNLNRPNAAYNFFSGSLDSRHEVQPGELLFAWSGTPGTSFGAHIWSGPRAALNQHIFRVLHSEELLDRKFFREAINNQLDELIRRAHGGAGLAHVTKDKFESIEVPVPSLAEQHRIVAKLEELFSELDAGVAALRRAQRRLTHYRQSLLQAAVTGELTREWRERQTHDIKLGKLDGLPGMWRRASLGALSRDSNYGTSCKCSYDNTGTAVLRIPNVHKGCLQFDNLKRAPDTARFNNDDYLDIGDLLIIRTNGSRNLIGRVAVVTNSTPEPMTFASYLIRFRIIGDASAARWISLALSAPSGRAWLEPKAATTAGQYNLSASKLAGFPIHLPPQQEREVILAELDRRLSAADALDATLQAGLRRAERLRQSILERAFRGELVPQDPSDEPAEALLTRLKAAVPNVPAPRRRGRPPKVERAESPTPRRRGRHRKDP